MATIAPGVSWRPIPRNWTNSRRRRTDGIVLHITASRTAKSMFGWFSNPSAQASSHFHVDVDGKTEQYVDADMIAWCQRAGNARMLSVETQGDGSGLWTQAQAAEILRIVVWASKHYGFPLVDAGNSRPTSRGIGLHRYGCAPWRVSGGEEWGPRGKVCPGNANADFVQSGRFLAGTPATGGGGGTPAPTPQPEWRGAMGWRSLSYGMSGDDVRGLQNYLNGFGYGLGVDGSFGPATQNAVKDWQSKNGLGADGSVGPATQTKMKATSPGTTPVNNPKPAPAPAPAPPKPTAPSIPQIPVDGQWGPGTTRRLQQFFGTTQDGVISGQVKGRHNAGVHSAQWGSGGSQLVAAIQRRIGVEADGYLGPNTVKALQRHMGTSVDGVISSPSQMVAEMQRRLNAGKF